MVFCWILQCLIGLSIEGNHDKLQILGVATTSDSPLVTTELMSAILLLVHALRVSHVGLFHFLWENILQPHRS